MPFWRRLHFQLLLKESNKMCSFNLVLLSLLFCLLLDRQLISVNGRYFALFALVSKKKGVFSQIRNNNTNNPPCHWSTTGLVCYECRSSGEITHEAECSPSMERTSECDKKYCTIYRREYVDPSGKIDEFHRSCEDRPAYLNAVIKTPNHVAYYRSCQQNLCNIGDGLVPSARALIQSDDSDTQILVVPGIGSSGDRRVSTPWLLHGLVLVVPSSAISSSLFY